MQTIRGILAVAAMLHAGAAFAQQADTRPNPFKAPPSEQERQLVQDERTRNVVRGMQGEIVDKVSAKFERKIDSIEDTLKRRIDDAVKTAAIPQPGTQSTVEGAQGIGSDTNTGAEKSVVPDGATFISCVNKKALYRDKDNALFKDDSATNRCSS
jgi:gamma-glutamyl:cysteine ligase YbdK (ATP-grasp superfamily)